jgi:hypothetical protein
MLAQSDFCKPSGTLSGVVSCWGLSNGDEEDVSAKTGDAAARENSNSRALEKVMKDIICKSLQSI